MNSEFHNGYSVTGNHAKSGREWRVELAGTVLSSHDSKGAAIADANSRETQAKPESPKAIAEPEATKPAGKSKPGKFQS